MKRQKTGGFPSRLTTLTLLCAATAASRSAAGSSALGSTMRACSRQECVLSRCRNLKKPLSRDPAHTWASSSHQGMWRDKHRTPLDYLMEACLEAI